jgi:hypothetical protein
MFKNQNRYNLFWLFVFFASVAAVGGAALTGPYWWQIQSTPTTIVGYGLTDAASITALTDHAASNTEVHGVGQVLGASEAATLKNKTITDPTNVISGSVITTGEVASDVIDADIARVNQLPNNASFTFNDLSDTPATYTGNALKLVRVNAGETALEYYTAPVGVSYKRAEATVGGTATSTVTFVNYIDGTTPVAMGDFLKCKVYINGVLQKYSNFTKTNSTQVESSQGDIDAGSLITLEQID